MLSALPMRSASVAIRLVSLPVCAALDGPARSTWIRTVAAGPGEIGSEGGHGEEGIGVVSIAMVSTHSYDNSHGKYSHGERVCSLGRAHLHDELSHVAVGVDPCKV